MQDGDGGLVLAVFASLAILGMFGFVLTEKVQQARVERVCLSKGYPQGDFRWIGPNYCIKRVDQTDSVLVLPE